MNDKCKTFQANVNFFLVINSSGYLLFTGGYLVAAFSYLIGAPGYFLLLLVPRLSNNAN